MKTQKSVFISAGEISGDFYAGEIIKRLKEKFDLEVFALGGEYAVQAGAHLIYDTTAIATFGFLELLTTFHQWKRVWNKTKKILKYSPPSVVILIDNPGFNLRIVRLCHQIGIPIIYFIPPQVWVWRRRRATLLSRYVDWILTIFPWEDHYFKGGQAQVKWVGHPIASKVPYFKFFSSNKAAKKIVFLPGSRKKEIDEYLKVIKKVIAHFVNQHRDYEFFIVLACESYKENVEKQLLGLPIHLKKREDLYQVLEGSSLSVSCSGTITLEVALMGIPQIIVYRISNFTYFLARLLLKKRFIGLPNILLNREVCPELIQNDFNSDNLIQTIEKMINDNWRESSAQRNAQNIRKILTYGDTYSQVVGVIENYLR
ncbi:MAG: lipid-A-disaccharide synthase [Candidatus Atribacteria bacterium]|nr:lipid-A-disaccharide synthase [Candidatus Atribacteria bacterium]